jgi:hypothetical protein
MTSCIDSFESMFVNLRKPVGTIQEVCDMQDYMKSVDDDIKKMESVIKVRILQDYMKSVEDDIKKMDSVIKVRDLKRMFSAKSMCNILSR